MHDLRFTGSSTRIPALKNAPRTGSWNKLTPERWQRIKVIFDTVVQLEAAGRASFLTRACEGDEALREEVESLLVAYEKDGSFIDSPAYQAASRLLATDQELPPGQIVTHYEILSTLGHGGMGKVYLAEDKKLNRKVALKVLPLDVINNRSRLYRFQQEARAASGLNHPNIITIHEIGAEGHTHFIATEFIEGETLRRKLQRARLEIGETLNVAIQIAAALEAAHRSNIVHRDIKPENVMVREDGLVKVLDFGLAKLTQRKEDAPTETRTLINTSPGVVMGTFSYMSPEQARGLPVDARTDIFSLGVVLYEMLTGRLPFAGETTSDVIAAILTREPAPASSFKEGITLGLDTIASKALAKKRAERYQTAKELLVELRRLQKHIESEVEVEQEFVVTRPVLKSDQSVSRRAEPRVAIRSLAVLPFTNASGESEMEYLSDGLTENILFSVSQLPQVQVIARSAVFRHKGSGADALSIGRDLGVGAVVTGRVRHRGPQLLVSAELIDVESGWQLWGAQYKRSSEDLYEIEDEIASEISQTLRLRLAPEKQRLLNRRRTESHEAYHLYLKGRFHWAKRTEESLYRALQFFREAIDADPTYALAYAGLAEGYVPLAYYSYLPPKEAAPKAKAAAQRALEIEPELPEALAALGSMMAVYDWDIAGAEALLRTGVELDPQYARGRQALAECLMIAGRSGEAVAEMEAALEIDPLALHLNAALVMHNYFARRPSEALECGRKALELDPNFYPTRLYVGLAYEAVGRLAEAVTELQQARALSNGSTFVTATLAGALAEFGKDDEASALLTELKEIGQKRYVPQTTVAAAHICRGALKEALACLERAGDERCIMLPYALTVDPRFDAVRGEERFQRLVHRFSARGEH